VYLACLAKRQSPPYQSFAPALQATMLEQHERKKSEYQEWSTVVDQAIVQKDTAAKEAVMAFQKIKKHVFR